MPIKESQNDESCSLAFDELTLTAAAQHVLRNASQLDEVMLSQLDFLIQNANYWWLDSMEDCFDKKKVDDGILVYKKMQSTTTSLVLHYWLGYFGGNPIGYVLIQSNDDTNWKVLIENCDTDFIWRGEGDAVPRAFLKQVKMAAYGDKYSEEDD